MKIFANGREILLPSCCSFHEFLEKEGYLSRPIVVECNETIVPKKEYATTLLKEGDRLEIITFVGGG